MSSLWNSTTGDSGILRKTDNRNNLEDLLVFGYACKLFRDDEKAKEIDQGKHLIPWMGENSLKIDRYDGRGALSDLSPYESSKEGYDALRWMGLSENEKHLEQLCDEERYYSLHINEEEEELYKEEELKRQQNKGQVEYNYDVPKEQENQTQPQEEDDEPYTPRPELDTPLNMTLPKTMKENARIEKTAAFISKEGPQMEILLKTKQANNPQFSFMNKDDPLYQYYRHVLMAIKTGRYKIQSEVQKTESEEEKKDEDHYLHPSLASTTSTTSESILSTTSALTSVFYKPSANCAYSQLVNRIQGTQPQQDTPTTTTDAQNGLNAYNQQTYLYYQQYGYYPSYEQYYAAYGQNAATYEQYKQYYEKQINNPYAQIVSNVKSKESSETPAENGVQSEYYNNTNPEIAKAPVIYSQQPEPPPPEPEKPKLKKAPLFSLAQYSGSESETEDDGDGQNSDAQAVVVPPADMQIIVDKMASYVAKNGIDFENIVKSKGDPRFIFLDPTHVFHAYYKYKLKEFGGGEKKTVVEKTEEKTEEKIDKSEEVKTDKKIAKPKDKKIITPVSFSIKKSKDDSVTRDKSALPVEDSTDDEDGGKDEETSNVSQSEENSQSTTEKTEDNAENNNISQIIEIEDPIMELIDLTDDMEDKRDLKRAEDRLKGKLALAAREKLAAKNKAMQLERKKRAAAFLSQLKAITTPKSDSQDEVSKLSKSPLEEGEINGDTPPIHNMPEEVLKAVYHIEPTSTSSPKRQSTERNQRSRSPRHKSSSHHRRKSHKRSHSKKRKRERHSRERKKSKRKRRSRSRSHSKSKHRSRIDDSYKSRSSKDDDRNYSSSSSSDSDTETTK